ncbi:MAG: hypothetical protein JWR50_4134 [Mucilaginibacter sp.]|nr:hypothetical protein [Mucilaginibacter sp.]
MEWLKELIDSLQVHLFFKVADTPDHANWWYDKDGKLTDDPAAVVRKEPVEIPRYKIANTSAEFIFIYDREFARTGLEETSENHTLFHKELKKHTHALIDKHASNRTYETTDFKIIATAESFLNWLNPHMIANPQPMTELTTAVNVRIVDKLPYDIHAHRLFSFDHAILIHYHYNEGDDLAAYQKLVFSRENIQLALRFEKLFKAADKSGVIELLDEQFNLIAATEVPESYWLDNVEKIIAHHQLLKRPEYAKHDAVKLWFKQKRLTIKPILMSEVFISYSWDSPEHEQQVINFTNYLRENGFDTSIDKLLNQKKTAINFVRMMHEAFRQHPKVIILLSVGYKQKAESFTGGVGEEYELLINDIKKNEQKYILASFGGRSDAIVPMGLAGRDIVDLSVPAEHQRLFAKLQGHQVYEFVPVAGSKPELPTIKPQPFVTAKEPVPISILPPRFTFNGNSSSQGGLYTRYELLIDMEFKNISGKAVAEFAGQVKLNKFMVLNAREYRSEGDHAVLDFQVQRKVFPGQTTMGLQFPFELNRGNIYQVIDSTITVTVYTEHGNDEASFNFKDLVKIRRPNQNWGDPEPIELSMFTG